MVRQARKKKSAEATNFSGLLLRKFFKNSACTCDLSDFPIRGKSGSRPNHLFQWRFFTWSFS